MSHPRSAAQLRRWSSRSSRLSSSLAGGATAATLLTGKDIANKSLTGKDLKKKSVTGKHVKNRSLVAKDFKKGQLPAGHDRPSRSGRPRQAQPVPRVRQGAGRDRKATAANGATTWLDRTPGPAGADGADGADGAQGRTRPAASAADRGQRMSSFDTALTPAFTAGTVVTHLDHPPCRREAR